MMQYFDVRINRKCADKEALGKSHIYIFYLLFYIPICHIKKKTVKYIFIEL